jgi:hypothetical protein
MAVTTRPGSQARAEPIIGDSPPRLDLERAENGDESPERFVVTGSVSHALNVWYDDDDEGVLPPESYYTEVALTDFLLETKIRFMEFCLKKLRSSDEETSARSLEWLDSFLFENVFYADMAERQEAFFQLGGHILVVLAMHHHPECKAVQEFGMCVLQNAAYENPSLRTAVALVGGMQAILDAMKRLASYEDIMSSGFRALCDIACDHEANSELLVKELPFLMERMAAFTGSSIVMKEACRLLWSLSSLDKMKKPIFYANGVSSLAAAIECHKGNQCIQTFAGEAIKRLL